MTRHHTIRTKYFSRVINWHTLGVLLLTLIILSVSMGYSLLSGEVPISLRDLFNSLFDAQTAYDLILFEVRLPRIVMACIVGMLLGMSGLILQTIVKNPLASPDILGISNGASVGVILFLAYFGNVVSITYLPFAGMITAFLTMGCIYLFSMGQQLLPERIILTGIAVSLFMGAVATFFFVFSSSSATLLAYLWLTGTVYGTTWEEVTIMVSFCVVLLPLLIMIAKGVNHMQLNDDSCIGLGINIFALRAILLLLAVALASIAISFAGGISFVGLIAPHIAKRLIEHSFWALLLLSSFVGAIIVVGADFIGRILFSPLDLPAGIFVSLIGAPFFIYLLFKQFGNRNT